MALIPKKIELWTVWDTETDRPATTFDEGYFPVQADTEEECRQRISYVEMERKIAAGEDLE